MQPTTEPAVTPSHRRRSRLHALKGPAILLLIVIGFYWKVSLTKQYTWLNSLDFAYMIMPLYQFQAAALQHGVVPLWDPHQWGGQPVVGQLEFGLQYPLSVLLFLMPMKNGHIQLFWLNWYFVAMHYMAALFCYLLCRDLKLSLPASLLAGIAFGLSGYIGSTDWPQVLNGAVWLPLVFLFFLRAMRGERPVVNCALAGVFLGLSFLGGHHQMPFYITLAIGGTWIYYFFVVKHRDTPFATRAAWVAVFGLFLALVSAVQTLSAFEYGKLAVRWVGSSHDPVGWNQHVPYMIHAHFSLLPSSLWGIVLPWNVAFSDPFLGVAVFSLTLFGLAICWRERMTRLFAALALGGLVYAFGRYDIFHGLLYVLVPLVEKARETSRALFIFHFGAIILAAYGFDAFNGALRDGSRWPRRLIWALIVFGAFIYLLLLPFSMVKLERTLDYDRMAMSAFVALLLGLTYYGWSRGQISDRAGAISVLLLTLLDIGAVIGSGMPHKDQGWGLLDKLSEHDDIVKFLRRQPGFVRVEKDDVAIPYNFGDWHGIDAFETYLASLTTNMNRVRGEFSTRMMYAINFYLGPKPRRDDQVEVFSGKSGIKVYANPQVFPLAWSVHDAVQVRAEPEIFAKLNQPLDRLRNQTFLAVAPPKLDSCAGPDNITLLNRQTNSLAIDADLKCKGMVIAGETFFPGWEARVDGKPAPIYEAYTTLRGVVVDAGHHRIEMRYRPRSVYLGFFLTLTGLVAAVALVMFARRDRFGDSVR